MKCIKRVYRERGASGHCSNDATIGEFCKTHSPEGTAARAAKKHARFESRKRVQDSAYDRNEETARRAAVYPKLVAALREEVGCIGLIRPDTMTREELISFLLGVHDTLRTALAGEPEVTE